MSEIDKLEIKIVADAADAEKSVKKLSKTIEGIGKTGDSTKQIREIKSALESIKTPEIEINGIKEFAKQARIIAQNFSKAAKSAKEIGASLKGVNLGQLAKKSKKESAPVEDYSHLKDIPIFDMGKQINGKPIQDAAKSMSDLTSETSSAVSVAGQLAAAMERVSENAAKTDRFSGIEKEISKNLGMTGVLDIDNGKFAETIEESKSLINGFRVDLEKLGLSEIKFPEVEKAEREFKNMENTVRVLTETIEELKSAGANAKQLKPLEKQLEKISQKSKIANLNLKDTIALARSKIPNIQEGLQENQGKKTQREGTRKRSNKSRGRSSGGLFGRSGGRNSFSLPKMVGMSVLYSTVFQLIGTIQSAFAEGIQSLAQYSQSVNANISSMMSALMQLRNAFAAAFEPILSVVAPYLATFISWLAKAINMLGQFIAALTGKGYAVQAKKVQMDYAKSLQKTAGGAGKAAKALKEMQDYTLGFDELHIIDTKQNDSGGAGGGGAGGAGDLLPTDMFETVEIDSKIQDLAKRFKELLPLITSIAAGLAAWKIAMGLFKQLAELKKKLQELQALSRLSLKLHRFPEVLSNIGLIIAELMKVAPTILGWSIVIGIIVGRFVYLYQTSESFRKGLERTKEIFKGILTVVSDVFKAVGRVLYDIGSGIWNHLLKPFLEFIGIDTSRIEEEFANFFRMIKDWLGKLNIDFGDLGITIAGIALLFIPGGQLFGGALLAFEGISVALRALGGVSDETWASIKEKAVGAWNAIKDFFKTTWDEIVSYYPEKWSEVKTSTAELWESVKTTISEKWKAIKDFFTKTIPQIVSDIVKWFSEMPSKVGTAISVFFTETIPNWATSVYNTFSEKVNNIVTSVATWFAQLPQKIYEKIILFLEKITLWKDKSIEKVNTEVPKILDKVAEWFGKLPQKIMEELKKTIESIKSIGGFILDGILEGASNFGNKVGGFVKKLLEKVNKEAEIHSPSRLFKRETGVWVGAGIIEGMEESVKGAGSVIDEIVDKVSGGGSLAPVVSVEAPDISQWDATWAILRENFERLKADIISSMNAFYSSISAMTTNFGTVSKAQITAYLLKVYDNIYNTFDAIRQTLQQVSDEVTRMLNQMVSDANSLAGLTGKKYSHVGGYTMQQAQRFNIEMFANGGFPRSGELFIAREAGPELVGSIGGKTAVGGNDQIERAIFNAVLTAMSQAMANGSSQPIELNQKIELDGDVIYNNQQKVSARRGINFGLGAFQR
jgi:phage-related protein|nr:MAG TPA: minor tail protein [Caudoviricetes sp.]